MNRKAYHHGDLRRALVVAARELLSQAGAANLTIRGVAAHAGVSTSAPYRHFQDKEALLAAVAVQGFTELAEATALAAESGSDPLRTLPAVGEAYVRVAGADPAMYNLMFGATIADRSAHPALLHAEQETMAAFAEVVRSGVSSGAIATHDVEDILLTMHCAMHGLASLVAAGEIATYDAVGHARRVMAIIDAGLVPRP